MPSIADIVLADGKATPVNHTFKVKACNNGLSVWEDRSGGIAIGYWQLKVKTEDNANVRKVMMWLNQPVLEAAVGANQAGYTPAARVAYLPRGYTEFYLPMRGTTAERSDLVVMHTNLLLNPVIRDVIVNGSEFYG